MRFTALAVVGFLLAGCATPDFDQDSLFYPAPPQRPRIQFLTQFAGADDVEGAPSMFMRFLVGEQGSSRRMRKPTAVAAFDGVIYVADPGWGTVLRLDLKNKVFDPLPGAKAEGQLRSPVAIAIDAQGNKFIADSVRKQVVQFDREDAFVRSYGNPEKLRPTGVAVDEDFVYVVNRMKHRVEVLDRRTKARERTIGEFGERTGEFNVPTSLSIDERGHLFVTDAINFRIQEFDVDGEFVHEFGFLGDGPGTFARPRGTAVDNEGHLYVSDGAFENVQIWDTENAQVLLAFGGSGMGPGSMYLPADVFVSADLVPHFESFVDPGFVLKYVVLVANNYGPNKIGVYGFVEPRDPSRYDEFALPDEDEE